MLFISAALALFPFLLPHVAASAVPERRQGLAQVITECTVPDTAALTFDDGPFDYINVRSSCAYC
jgi:hypothetical protein